MPRIRMLVLCALVACLIVPAVVAAPASATAEDQMIGKINAWRAKHGLPGIRKSKSLTQSAERYSRKQLRSGYFGHSNRIQASSKYRTLGEILAFHGRTGSYVRQTFRMWLDSGGHRAVIMDRRFRYAGAGLASGRFRGGRASIWTVQFGAR